MANSGMNSSLLQAKLRSAQPAHLGKKDQSRSAASAKQKSFNQGATNNSGATGGPVSILNFSGKKRADSVEPVKQYGLN